MATSRGQEQIGISSPVNWSQWADGQVWELHRGEDFPQTVKRARLTFLMWASRHGLRTHSEVVDDDTLKIQIVRPAAKDRPRRPGRPSLVDRSKT